MLTPMGSRHDNLGDHMLITRKRVIEKAELQRNLKAWHQCERERKQRAALKRQSTSLGQQCPELVALQQKLNGVRV